MLRRLRRLVSVFLVVLIAACAGQSEQSFKRSEVWSAENGIFYFYRDDVESAVSGIPWKVSIDGHVLGHVRPGEFIARQWKNGDYVLMTQLGETLLESKAVLEPKGEVFVTLESASGVPRMVHTSGDEAIPILERLSVARFERGVYGTLLEKRDSGVVVIENPAVARGVFVYPDVQARLRGEGNCHAAYGMRFRIDHKGFPRDIRITNRHQFTPEQAELMVSHFKDYRFRTYRENNRPVDREATRIMLFSGPRTECPILPRDRVLAGEMIAPDARGLSCPDPATVNSDWAANELWSATRECMDAGKHEHAFMLFMLARAVTGFDMRRVEDKSAHFLSRRMFEDAMTDLDPRTRRQFNALAAEGNTPGKRLHIQACELLARTGPPTYPPEYMRRAGADHFFGLATDGLVAGFDPVAVWLDIAEHGEKCATE